ncbi:hypothetical protein AABC73_18760 [Pseudomonas sp. G.S.17]|uniref:hypothetical protein n=1 Tax=Pseudomonas sp. G.S.17 TaxID=3137451 RepID=UPI00311CB9A0
MISGVSNSYSSYTSTSASATSSASSKKFQEQLPAKLDTDGSGAISATELTSALDADSNNSVSVDELMAALSPNDSNQTSSNDAAAQALSKMVAALSERYDTEGNKPVGKYLSVAA